MKSIIEAKQLGKWDVAGMGLSIACAVHCLGTPLLLSALPLLGLEVLENEAIESSMIALIALLAGVTFFSGYRVHGRRAHFILGGAGLLMFLLVRPAVSEALEPYATLVGGVAFVVGHYLNRKWSRPCASH